MFAAERTCSILSKTIRKVALELSPGSRASSFEEKIKQQKCRANYDDLFPHSVCSQPDACSARKQKSCEESCCARDEVVTLANCEGGVNIAVQLRGIRLAPTKTKDTLMLRTV